MICPPNSNPRRMATGQLTCRPGWSLSKWLGGAPCAGLPPCRRGIGASPLDPNWDLSDNFGEAMWTHYCYRSCLGFWAIWKWIYAFNRFRSRVSAFRSVFTPLPAGQHVIFKPTSRMHRPLGQSWLSLPYAWIKWHVHCIAWIVVCGAPICTTSNKI